MDSTGHALVVIERPTLYFFGGARRLSVWIDGSRTGKVRCGALAEFAVGPGEHTVSVSLAWLRSQPLRVVAGSGSRTCMTVGVRWLDVALRMFLPLLIACYVAYLLVRVLWSMAIVLDQTWWLLLFVTVVAAAYGSYVLVTWKFICDYWVLWTLEPPGTTSSRLAVDG